jgi:hypothetical protein
MPSKTPAEIAALAEIAMRQRLDAADPRPRITDISAPDGYESGLRLTAIATADGTAHIAVSGVVMVSQPMQKPNRPVVRRVGLGNGLYVLALNTPENLDMLGLPDEAESLRQALIAAQRPRAKRTRRALKPTEAK